MPIQVLPTRVAAQIAAGEVVERPASIVKELVENSIDAGASTINVSIKGGGTNLISVSDDGAGIPPEQVELAFQRHATSKLVKVDDLLRITTLGFRGEALPSIAAATRLSCVTKTDDNDAAVRYEVHFGEVKTNEKCGARTGTSIRAENLFGYQPARLKFLKSRPTEAAHVQRTVARYAIAFPNIRFAYTSEDSLQFQTSGNGKLIDVVLEIMGSETAAQMLPLLHTQDDITIEGYTSNTSLHRSNRNDIALFVNQRIIQDRDLAWATEQAYRQTLPRGRHPLAIILIKMPPELVDVNAHPTKLEVRFRSDNKVFNAVNKTVSDALSAHGIVHNVSETSFMRRQPRARHTPDPTQPQQPGFTTRQEVNTDDTEINGSPYERPYSRPQPTTRPTVNTRQEPPLNTTPPTDGFENLRDMLPELTCIGQAKLTYILADGPQGIYIIDQHAAQERVIFDQTLLKMREDSPAKQILLFPQEVELDEVQHLNLLEHLELVTHHGFQVEQHADRRWLISALPQSLTSHRSPDPAAVLQSIIDEFAVENLLQETEYAMAATVACHSSARAGDRLQMLQMQAIIQQLANTAQPHNCPHGRPTLTNISQHRLELEFRRC